MKLFTYDNLMKNGRLGNQLWQIAATIKLADDNNGIARFNPNWEYRKYFNVPNEYFEPYNPNDYEIIDGGTEYYQHLKYIDSHKDVFWKYFQPKIDGSISQEVQKRNFACNDCCMYRRVPIGIHVRRGDYLKHPEHFPLPTSKYYQDSLKYMIDRFDKTFDCSYEVFFFSDDIKWCKNNKDFFGLDNFPIEKVHFSDGVARPVEVADRKGEPEDQWDLFGLSECPAIIMSNSTFSWWASFIGLYPVVTYPSTWFGPAVAALGDNTECPALDDWKEIQC